MAAEGNSAAPCVDGDPLVALINQHQTVLLKPVHAKDRVLGAQGYNIHISREFMPL